MERLTENAISVLESRYLLKDKYGKFIETPVELFQRVAKAIAKAELKFKTKKDAKVWEERFFLAMSELQFIPNSPALMNAGTELNQLSACFVLPVEDSISEIFKTLRSTALIQQSGGGTGFNFSHIRPNGDFVANTGGIASGPICFMKIFDAATENIKQGGKRRGANMGILNVDHPDIIDFISEKETNDSLRNFNVSVGISDAFMRAVEKNADWNLIHPGTKKRIKKIKARKLWDLIIESAWRCGDPGLIFIDQINRKNPTPKIGKMESTNPCGEVPLLPFESCNLGSINLSKFVDGKKINWNGLSTVIQTGIRFLDNVVEINNHVLPETELIVKSNRKIGLGVMGWADLLIQMEIPYASQEAIRLGEKIMKFVRVESLKASAELAKQRGVFKNWKKSVYYPKLKLRNATVNSIAPTGTISIIANASSSIEPLFALAFKREHVLGGKTLTEINHLLVDHLKKEKIYSEELLREIIYSGKIPDKEGISASFKELFKTALEIDPEWHLKHQAAFQKYTDNAVSKTINLKEEASVKDVDHAYRMAWKLKTKGVTIFRYGSKNMQVLKKITDPDAFETYNSKACKVCAD